MNELEERIRVLEDRLNMLERSDRYQLQKLLQIWDGRNIQLGTTTGTQIGTGATQKLAFFGATPIAQPAEAAVANVQSGAYVQADVQSIADLANSLRTTLHNYGLTA